jgi:hypothetical protein
MNLNDDTLLQDWIAAKNVERGAVEYRRLVEDRLSELTGLKEDFEGTVNLTKDGHSIKIIGRMTRKVDADLLQEIAAETGLTEHLSNLFRWKPEINATAWGNASVEITGQLSKAITTTPGRPSYTIEKIEE